MKSNSRIFPDEAIGFISRPGSGTLRRGTSAQDLARQTWALCNPYPKYVGALSAADEAGRAGINGSGSGRTACLAFESVEFQCASVSVGFDPNNSHHPLANGTRDPEHGLGRPIEIRQILLRHVLPSA
jgi:hypothetical protein